MFVKSTIINCFIRLRFFRYLSPIYSTYIFLLNNFNIIIPISYEYIFSFLYYAFIYCAGGQTATKGPLVTLETSARSCCYGRVEMPDQ